MKKKVGWDGKRVQRKVDTLIHDDLNETKREYDAKVTELITLLEDLGCDEKADKRQFLQDICEGMRCAVLPLHFCTHAKSPPNSRRAPYTNAPTRQRCRQVSKGQGS